MLKKPGYRNGLKSVIVFLALTCYFTLAIGDEEIEATAEYSTGANQCMTCHREGRDPAAHEVFLTPMGISDAENSPFAEGSHDCETCHGPSAHHIVRNKKMAHVCLRKFLLPRARRQDHRMKCVWAVTVTAT